MGGETKLDNFIKAFVSKSNPKPGHKWNNIWFGFFFKVPGVSYPGTSAEGI